MVTCDDCGKDFDTAFGIYQDSDGDVICGECIARQVAAWDRQHEQRSQQEQQPAHKENLAPKK